MSFILGKESILFILPGFYYTEMSCNDMIKL